MPKNKKLALNSGIETNQILTNDDEVCSPGLFCILLAVEELRNTRTLCTSNIRAVQNPFNLKTFPNAKMQSFYITFYLVSFFFIKSNEQWAQIISQGVIIFSLIKPLCN